MRVVFVSTHFDDAVGSCAGAILRLQAVGAATQVLTVMSRPAPAPFVKHLVLTSGDWRAGEPLWFRAREDKRACEVLQCGRAELGLTDAVYRRDGAGRRLYTSPALINAGIHRLDERLVDEIVDRLRRRPAADDILAFPLAVGDHVDHQLVAKAGLKLLEAGAPVFFYRDFFYQGATTFAQRALAGGQSAALRLDVAEIEKKIAALGCYVSQMPSLYPEQSEMADMIRSREAVENFILPTTADLRPSGLMDLLTAAKISLDEPVAGGRAQ